MEIIVISEKDLHRRVDINGNQNIKITVDSVGEK